LNYLSNIGFLLYNKRMPIESEPQHGKKVSLPEIGVETTLPANFDLVIRGEVPSLYERIRELRGMGPSKNAQTIVLPRRFETVPEAKGFFSRLIRFVGKVRDKIELTLENTVDALQDHFDPFADADENTAHGFSHVKPDGRNLFEIAYSTGLDPDMKLFAVGHEYGELLQNEEVKGQADLQKALDAEGLKIDVTHYWKEDFADLAGFLALLRAKKAGDESIRIPFFRTNADNREKMGRLFGLEPPIGPRPKPREW
jgi:hypothetical protein